MSEEKYDANLEERKNNYSWASDEQWDCVLMANELFGGFHHLPKIQDYYPGIAMRTATDLATFDGNFLTRAVFLAHDRCIRFSIGAASPKEVKLIFHKRKKREGKMSERHPSLQDAVSAWRN